MLRVGVGVALGVEVEVGVALAVAAEVGVAVAVAVAVGVGVALVVILSLAVYLDSTWSIPGQHCVGAYLDRTALEHTWIALHWTPIGLWPFCTAH